MNENEKHFLSAVLGGKGLYEGVTFVLPGGSKYTPDFVDFHGGRLRAHEVKDDYRLHSQGRALTAFREARAAFHSVEFCWWVRDQNSERGYSQKKIKEPDFSAGEQLCQILAPNIVGTPDALILGGCKVDVYFDVQGTLHCIFCDAKNAENFKKIAKDYPFVKAFLAKKDGISDL